VATARVALDQTHFGLQFHANCNIAGSMAELNL